jgi:hypothetical protein
MVGVSRINITVLHIFVILIVAQWVISAHLPAPCIKFFFVSRFMRKLPLIVQILYIYCRSIVKIKTWAQKERYRL